MGYDYVGGYGGGCGCGGFVSPVAEAPIVAPISSGCGGFTTVGVILVLFILLVIVSRAFV